MNFDSPTPMRDAFGKALLELGAENPNVVALTADLSEAIRVHWFAEKYPERFFQMGISENDMMGTAAGLAIAGKIPFATTFAIFATSLANQPVRLSIGYNRANVKIATSHSGITVGEDGATHQAFEDLALMRMIPGMTIVAPCDANEAYRATRAVAEYEGPVYLRLGRIPTPVVTSEEAPFTIGRAVPMRDGGDVAILSIGSTIGISLDAADQLSKEGISASVLNVHTLKPIDEDAIVTAAERCGAIVTVEEHSIIGGLGGAVAEVLGRTRPTPMEMVGVKDTFGESGKPQDILERYGITATAVVAAARHVVRRRTGEARLAGADLRS